MSYFWTRGSVWRTGVCRKVGVLYVQRNVRKYTSRTQHTQLEYAQCTTVHLQVKASLSRPLQIHGCEWAMRRTRAMR